MLVKCHIWLKMVERHRNRSCQKLFHFLLLMIFRSKVENQIPLRNALARFFGILERSGRYLTLGYKIQWPLAMFFGKTVWLVWKDQRQTTFVRCYSSIIHCFFSRTATQAYLLNREGMVYTRGHLMLTEMFQRFLVLFVFFGQLLLLSMQSPVKDGFRLEAWEGLFPDHSQTTCVVLSFRCSTPRGLILPFVTAVFCLMGCVCVCVSLNVWCFTFRSIEVLGHLLKQIREQRSLAFFLCELAHVREQHVQQ